MPVPPNNDDVDAGAADGVFPKLKPLAGAGGVVVAPPAGVPPNRDPVAGVVEAPNNPPPVVVVAGGAVPGAAGVPDDADGAGVLNVNVVFAPQWTLPEEEAGVGPEAVAMVACLI